MQKTKKEIFLFDLGGVILASDFQITYQALINLGVSEKFVAQYFQCAEYSQFSRGQISAAEFCQALRRYFQAPLNDDQLKQAHQVQIFGLIPGMADLIKSLSQKYQLAFVTDTNAWQTERQQELIDLGDLPVFTSDGLGMKKADPAILDKDGLSTTFFSQVLDQLDVFPDQCLLIDDSPEKVQAAQIAGIETILFTGTRENLEIELIKSEIRF